MEDMRVAILNDDVVPPGEGSWPFHRSNLNDGYAMLFAVARDRGIPLILARDSDYGEGRLDRGWLHDGSHWSGWQDIGVLMVYDQFPSSSPRGREMVADLEGRGIPVFNDPKITMVVDDKLLSYRNFPEMVPYTHHFKPGSDDPKQTLEAFLDGVEKAGFGEIDSFIAKAQVGWGARHLFRFTQENIGDLYHLPHEEFVLQPFLESSVGIPEIGVRGRHDFRILVENGRFVTAFVRQPAQHDWIANYFDPDEMIFINDVKDVPADIMNTVFMADARFGDYSPRLISYDMARLDNGRVVCWEMNSRPGIAPDSQRPEDLQSAWQLMHAIANCFEIQLRQL